MVKTQSTLLLPIVKLSEGFRLRRIRPGVVYEKKGQDPALGPFAAVDHAWLRGKDVVPMHEHRNDEILSYVMSGTMMHRDSAGRKESITRQRLMMMNAGRSFWHEESAPDEPVEMLQIFVRPEAEDLEPMVQFYDRPEEFNDGRWNLLAGPDGSRAPLRVRNRVYIYDAHPTAGALLEVPYQEGLVQWAYLLQGELLGEGVQVRKGEAFAAPGGSLPKLKAAKDSVIVLFLSDPGAPAVVSGTQSGHGARIL